MAGGGSYFVCVISHVSHLRLIHSLDHNPPPAASLLFFGGGGGGALLPLSLLFSLGGGLRVESPTSGWRCVLRPAIVPVVVPPSSRFGPAPSRWVPLLRAGSVWGLQPFASPLSSFRMWSPFGSKVSFCHS